VPTGTTVSSARSAARHAPTLAPAFRGGADPETTPNVGRARRKAPRADYDLSWPVFRAASLGADRQGRHNNQLPIPPAPVTSQESPRLDKARVHD